MKVMECPLTNPDPKAGTIELVVKVTPAMTPGTETQKAMQKCAADLGIALKPLSPDRSDSELATYHTALVPAGEAQTALERLRKCEGVEAAYTKSRGEPPHGGM